MILACGESSLSPVQSSQSIQLFAKKKTAECLSTIFGCFFIMGYNTLTMSWSSSRQFVYGSIFLLIVLVLIGIPSYFIFFNKPQTCFDGKMNQNESGVDCGGICAKACIGEVVPEPIILWSRAFKVTEGRYNLVAYVQNANVDYVSEPAEYSFRVYDKENVLIGLVDGFMTVPPVKSYPIFEQGFDAGKRIPAKVLFQFNQPVTWNKYGFNRPELSVSEPVLTRATTTPRIEAKVINNTLARFENIEVVVVVYGIDDNAIAASRTFVPTLMSRSEAPVVFTWPEPFTQTVSKVEIIPKLKF